MTNKKIRLGLCTGGGDCPGLNAVIHAVIKQAVGNYGMEVYGVRDGLTGLIEEPNIVFPVGLNDTAGIHTRGGTILGTTNKGNPFREPKQAADLMRRIAKAWKNHGLDAMIVIGGDGTQFMARHLSDAGLPIVGIPKTIDNDLYGSDETIGFSTAVETASEAAARLQSSADAHNRIMILEVMGRDAGHIALHSGLASAADAALIPEVPYSYEALIDRIKRRSELGRDAYFMIVAEGAHEHGGTATFQEATSGTKTLGGVSHKIARVLHERTGIEARVTILGHIQRGGAPNAHDRILAALLGEEAVRCIVDRKFGGVVGMSKGQTVHIPYKDVEDRRRMVDLTSPFVLAAEGMGICLGRPSKYQGAV